MRVVYMELVVLHYSFGCLDGCFLLLAKSKCNNPFSDFLLRKIGRVRVVSVNAQKFK